MTDYESSVAAAINNLADAARTLAGVFASLSASRHSPTPYDQRQIAAVIMEDASTRFGDVLKKLNKRQRADLQAWIDGLCRGK